MIDTPRRITNFTFEGEELRVRGLANDSGTSAAGKPGYRMWLMEHKAGTWVKDAHTFLPNAATADEAMKRFGLTLGEGLEAVPWNG